MMYYIFSLQEFNIRATKKGDVFSYENTSGIQVLCTDRNNTGQSSYADAKIVGTFPDDQPPKTHVVIIDEDAIRSWMRRMRDETA